MSPPPLSSSSILLWAHERFSVDSIYRRRSVVDEAILLEVERGQDVTWTTAMTSTQCVYQHGEREGRRPSLQFVTLACSRGFPAAVTRLLRWLRKLLFFPSLLLQRDFHVEVGAARAATSAGRPGLRPKSKNNNENILITS